MTTSSSRSKGKTDGRLKVHRSYRCRGNDEDPPCKPSVQIAAHVAEKQVEWLLLHPWKIKPVSRNVKRLLTEIAYEWKTLSPTKKSARIRELVRSATWISDQRNTHITIDEINLERFIETLSV